MPRLGRESCFPQSGQRRRADKSLLRIEWNMKIMMTSKAFRRQAEIGRILGTHGSGGGPTVVVTAGLHGNEPAGVFAVLDLLGQLAATRQPFRGKVIGLAGNLAALQAGQRFIDTDLNRLWSQDVIEPLLAGSPEANRGAEHTELRELYTVIRQIMESNPGPFYFVDLHTTSSQSPPFIPFDDTLTNREFVEKFPVPGILGIEEFLPGTMLSYLTRYRAVAIGYEGGQHDDARSIDYHRAMLWLCLERAGCLSRQEYPQLLVEENLLREGAGGLAGFFEVRYRYAIQPGEDFRMLPGFRSFQPVSRQQPLAQNKSGAIPAPESGRIFMPLYQTQGADGFFLIRPVARIWLRLSKWLRQWHFERVLALLPGVRLNRDPQATLTVDTRVARFLANKLFHLLGYRHQAQEGTRIRFTRREP